MEMEHLLLTILLQIVCMQILMFIYGQLKRQPSTQHNNVSNVV